MFRGSSNFEKLLDKATSPLKLEPDWPVIIQICDQIRQGDVEPKFALSCIKKKMTNVNPHVVMFGLDVLESCVKNCGAPVHDEIGTKPFMESMRETIKTTQHENARNKLLELIQAWAHAFRNSPKYRCVQDTVNILKADGYKFPTLKESDAMFKADTAPEWADGDCCHRCRIQFSVIQRKHHCRACGQVFCHQCSSKTTNLPKYGIEKDVRVCESCFEKANKPSTTSGSKSDDLPIEYLNSSLAQQNQAPPPRKSEAELKEEEELQLAIALSQSEAENKSQKPRSAPVSTAVSKSYSPPPKFSLSTSPEVENPELARYLNRTYWQQQSAEFSNASAPAQQASQQPQNPQMVNQVALNGVEDEQMEEFTNTLRSSVEMFVNRMKSNSSRGRSIGNDSSVQTLFLNITAMHSRLLRYIQQQDDSRVYFEGLQDKLAQVKDARAALDALREEHREKLRREAEFAEKQRQMQMAQKLDIMRKKKQEYLAYQRQLALQRIQDQEREMQLRQEQQKQQYMMGSYSSMPYMPQGPQGGYIPDGMVPGRFPGPPPQQHNFPPYNPSSVPVDQLLAQQMLKMQGPGGTPTGGPGNMMMVMGGGPPGMGGAPPGMGAHPMTPPHHTQGPGLSMGQGPMPPHMGPPQQGPPAHPMAPPMGPSPQHGQPHMPQGPHMGQPVAPPMGVGPPQPGAPPMGVQGPPMGMMPPPGVHHPPPQEIHHHVKEEEKTAELISFD
ncbi:hepatocyte growth factor-regulated tyrosine kinase [Nesidiocoris tenuis]|uniref:Hepatocyte growth factor-regulated tyrosine kinase substrate n=1 Tax=Nesidiocoris tenuis TaxID=355587 RepID=A0ABN7B7U3_9HEMI|nr:hepatocyte growth factor-regulated tyrosine kinase [Nesidiocoris tenuis]